MAAEGDSEGVATWQEGGVAEKPVDAGDDISCCRDPALPAGSSPPVSSSKAGLEVSLRARALVDAGRDRVGGCGRDDHN